MIARRVRDRLRGLAFPTWMATSAWGPGIVSCDSIDSSLLFFFSCWLPALAAWLHWFRLAGCGDAAYCIPRERIPGWQQSQLATRRSQPDLAARLVHRRPLAREPSESCR